MYSLHANYTHRNALNISGMYSSMYSLHSFFRTPFLCRMGLYQRTAHKPYIPSLFSPLMLMNGFINCLMNCLMNCQNPSSHPPDLRSQKINSRSQKINLRSTKNKPRKTCISRLNLLPSHSDNQGQHEWPGCRKTCG